MRGINLENGYADKCVVELKAGTRYCVKTYRKSSYTRTTIGFNRQQISYKRH